MSPTFRFIPAMYRAAVVDCVKTQTRRVITPQPREGWELRPGPCYSYAPAIEGKDGMLDAGSEVYGIATEEKGWIATYGPPGTVLPVVTTWAVDREWDDTRPSIMDPDVICSEHQIWWNDGSTKPEWAGKSRPAMFFPAQLYPFARQARVVGVKAARVHSISKDDVLEEGLIGRVVISPKNGACYSLFHDDDDARKEFQWLWDSINAERGKGELKGQYAWKRNPWVFATSFEVLPA